MENVRGGYCKESLLGEMSRYLIELRAVRSLLEELRGIRLGVVRDS